MKPTEIMIGDWVKHTNPKTNESYYAKVSGICPVIGSDHKQTGWVIRFHKDDEPLDNPCPISCEPVPVTPEILKANGFVQKYEDSDLDFFWEEHEKRIEIWKRSTLWYIQVWVNHDTSDLFLSIKYVHEFQHAMRLIGLHDMGNDFKIQKGNDQ